MVMALILCILTRALSPSERVLRSAHFMDEDTVPRELSDLSKITQLVRGVAGAWRRSV